jgi:hypothetical protein
MNTKPKLVDPKWFAVAKPRVKIVIPTNTNNSLIINVIGLCILMIGCLCIYQRYIDRDKSELENHTRIIELNEYVKRNIK